MDRLQMLREAKRRLTSRPPANRSRSHGRCAADVGYAVQKTPEVADRTWQVCVEEARQCVSSMHDLRFKIADLCIEACGIAAAGKRHSPGLNDSAKIKRFAEEVGVARATLHDWVSVKRMVLNRLEL